ncbi:glycerate kinase [Negadavirga shengliensis]|uniref:Glycerate kinase n=1 Tax=Negadavirga shengliensis TaxID=1389218 RepID=A0ABV9T3F1_9BACT
MKWLIAPNAFKGTIEADRAASLIKDTILEIRPRDQAEVCPIADGGDGTCLLLSELLGLEKVFAAVNDPLGRPMRGFFGYDAHSRTAYLDVSTVSGIKWLKEYEKNPWICSSYGTGELIMKAMDYGAGEVVIGLGGSATVDMGTGILRAMGMLFLDEKGREIPMFSPYFLERIAHVQLTSVLPDIKFTFLCDVTNSYFGEEGAIPVFGPQKGLQKQDMRRFLQASESFYRLLQAKSENGISDGEGFGAAGGIALGISAFFKTQLAPGASYFFEKVRMKDRIKRADIIITGEGRYDHQSAKGKGSFELMRLVKELGKESWLITSGEEANESGFDVILQLPDLDFKEKEVIERAEEALVKTLQQTLGRYKNLKI